MTKVTIIGAGSLVFYKTLMNDFLATPALAIAHSFVNNWSNEQPTSFAWGLTNFLEN
tara:strand:- start:1039 stop:1209 length:171 start_codon:yes stop_codon:yes gene_type:complete